MVFESGRKARAETPRPVSRYNHFLERLKEKDESPKKLEKDMRKAYQEGGLRKEEFFNLIKKLKSIKDAEVKDVRTVKDERKKQGTNKSVKEEEREDRKEKSDSENKEESERRFSKDSESKESKLEHSEQPQKHGRGLFSKLLSNGNMRLGFFVVAMFALLFFVTKDVLSGRGEGEMLIFAIVLIGILFILGSSGSKHDSRDHL